MTERPAPLWEHFPHAADIGIRGYGETLEAAFTGAALALTAIVSDLEKVGTDRAVTVHCSAADPEVLLVDWLNALIYEMAVQGLLFGRYEVHIEAGTLRATAYGEPVDRARHQPAVEVKGATYTALAVRREPDGRWMAQCVVDV